MNAAYATEPTISDPLTWDEIRARYPDQWVCLVEMDRIEEDNFEFRSANRTSRDRCKAARSLLMCDSLARVRFPFASAILITRPAAPRD